MRGRVQCSFLGGPTGDEVIDLPPMHCRDRLSLEQEGWLQARPDGKFNVMRGRRPQDADWESYSVAVYNKVEDQTTSGVIYRFDCIETVNRCKGSAATTGRRCKHQALEGSSYCRQHRKIG